MFGQEIERNSESLFEFHTFNENDECKQEIV